jgi:hypothetical protein
MRSRFASAGPASPNPKNSLLRSRSLGQQIHELELATRPMNRMVDLALALRRWKTGEILLGAGGRWDRIERRFLPGPPERAKFIDLEESQVEFTRWFATFLRDLRQGRPRDVSLALAAGDRRGGKTFDLLLCTIALPGLAEAFLEAFPRSRIARCWVHKARNVMPLVPRRYQAEFQRDWDKMAYAQSRQEAQEAYAAFKSRWEPICADAVARFTKDLDALLVHYDFPREHWVALRTTNPIERVNKEFKRRSKAMEQLGSDGLKALLAFTAIRLEFGWASTPISSAKVANRYRAPTRRAHPSAHLDAVTRELLN